MWRRRGRLVMQQLPQRTAAARSPGEAAQGSSSGGGGNGSRWGQESAAAVQSTVLIMLKRQALSAPSALAPSAHLQAGRWLHQPGRGVAQRLPGALRHAAGATATTVKTRSQLLPAQLGRLLACCCSEWRAGADCCCLEEARTRTNQALKLWAVGQGRSVWEHARSCTNGCITASAPSPAARRVRRRRVRKVHAALSSEGAAACSIHVRVRVPAHAIRATNSTNQRIGAARHAPHHTSHPADERRVPASATCLLPRQ